MQEQTTNSSEVKEEVKENAAQEQNTEPQADAQAQEPAAAEQNQEQAAAQEQKEPTVEELLAAARDENAKLQDLYMRALAEAENARRRAEEAVEKAHKFGVEKFAKNLIPVLDSLEKALELNTNADDPMMQGVQATYRQFVQAMEKSGVTEINPVGEKFDPTQHQAIAMVPAPEGVEGGHVVEVFQRGWLIADRVLRPAMVSVAQKL